MTERLGTTHDRRQARVSGSSPVLGPAKAPVQDAKGAAEITPFPVPTLETEWALLLAGVSVNFCPETVRRLCTLMQGHVDWPALVHLADYHGVASLLYQNLVRMGDSIPDQLLLPLRQQHENNVRKCLFLTRELIRVLDFLQPMNIEILPYKGVVLSQAVYGDVASRQSGDIDVLVRTSDLPRIKAAIRELGYTPHEIGFERIERAYVASGYEYTFDHPAAPNLLELQWAMQPSFYSIDFDMDAVFERAVTAGVAGRSMKTLSPEDLLLMLSVHAAKHVWGRLIWLCDIAQIATRQNLDWNWIESQAKALGIERILGVSFLLAKSLLQAAIPPSWRSRLLADDAVKSLADEIRDLMVRSTPYNVESVSYFGLMMRLRERRVDRLRFLRRLIFTPGPGEWEAIRLPPLLFPLYPLVRLGRLAARLGRV